MTTSLVLRLALSGLAATLAGAAADRALRELRLPTRWSWAAALALTAVASVALAVGLPMPLALPRAIGDVVAAAVPSAAASPAGAGSGGGVAAATIAWVAASLALLTLLVATHVRQRRRLEGATVARVGDVDVLVTPALGPALVGVVRTRVVAPAWLMERSEAERALVVRHELEHAAARDPLLAACGLVVACLVPWNPLVWLQLRRLRLAIELDCDARVLRDGASGARTYGRLLVDVAERLARGTPLATALAFPRSFLEERIRMMTKRQRRPARAIGWALGAAVLVAAACADAQDPVATDDAPGKVQLSEVRSDASQDSPREVILQRTPGEAGTYGYVERLDGVTAEPGQDAAARSAVGHFTAKVDEDGKAFDVELEQSGSPELDRAARAEIAESRFRRRAGEPGDQKVEGTLRLRPTTE